MRRILGLGMVLALATLPTKGWADETGGFRFAGLGPRVGVSINPHQVVVGGHVDWGDPFPHTTLLLPVLEAGIGDGRFVGSAGADLTFRFLNRWEGWTPFAGGEIALVFGTQDAPGGGDEGFSDLGLIGIVGLQRELRGGNRFATEIKFGIVDAPDVKFLASWTLSP